MATSFYKQGDIVAVKCKESKGRITNHLGRITTAPKGQGMLVEVEWLTDDGCSKFNKTLIYGKLVDYKDRWDGLTPVPKMIVEQIQRFTM